MDKQSNILKNLVFVFPVMAYFLLEAVIVGFFIFLVWKFFLSHAFGNLVYLQIVAIYWIIKMLLFDVFKLIAGLSSAGSNMEKEMQENEKDNETL